MKEEYKMMFWFGFTFLMISMGGTMLSTINPHIGRIYWIGFSYYFGAVSRNTLIRVFFPHRYQTSFRKEVCTKCSNFIPGMKISI